jgi:pyridoxamine 5'-phosphate oxidase
MSETPIKRLKNWLDEAKSKVEGNWNAMCVSTVDAVKGSDSRIVLLKQLDEDKIVFFTNYQSKKGEDITSNNMVSIVFFWDTLGRQIRIKGRASKTSREVSESYYNSRALGSRVSAILSQQSKEIESYESLREEFEKLKKNYANKSPSCPAHWGGIEVEIFKIEFWQEHESRLHERCVFTKNKDVWSKKYLSP